MQTIRSGILCIALSGLGVHAMEKEKQTFRQSSSFGKGSSNSYVYYWPRLAYQDIVENRNGRRYSSIDKNALQAAIIDMKLHIHPSVLLSDAERVQPIWSRAYRGKKAYTIVHHFRAPRHISVEYMCTRHIE